MSSDNSEDTLYTIRWNHYRCPCCGDDGEWYLADGGTFYPADRKIRVDEIHLHPRGIPILDVTWRGLDALDKEQEHRIKQLGTFRG
jgi:hypothetical protein